MYHICTLFPRYTTQLSVPASDNVSSAFSAGVGKGQDAGACKKGSFLIKVDGNHNYCTGTCLGGGGGVAGLGLGHAETTPILPLPHQSDKSAVTGGNGSSCALQIFLFVQNTLNTFYGLMLYIKYRLPDLRLFGTFGHDDSCCVHVTSWPGRRK